MAAAKGYTAEQIVADIEGGREVAGQGDEPGVCRQLGVSEQTCYRWRTKYGAMKEDEAHPFKALEHENARLKRVVAEQALDISMLRDLTKETFEPDPPSGRRRRAGRGTFTQASVRIPRAACAHPAVSG